MKLYGNQSKTLTSSVININATLSANETGGSSFGTDKHSLIRLKETVPLKEG
jgi:hypothetical protein